MFKKGLQLDPMSLAWLLIVLLLSVYFLLKFFNGARGICIIPGAC